jgi:prepilin-type N-terminal cleavage/methylation domain-containing protein
MRNANSVSSPKGFTLIELLIVIAIIGILLGAIVPLYQSSVRKANEAAAVATLHAIRVAEAKYIIDHKGQYGTFQQLFEQGYLDKRMNHDQPHDRGYVFVITLIVKSENTVATFSLSANPESRKVWAQPAGTFTTWTPRAEPALAIPDRRLLQTRRFEREVSSNQGTVAAGTTRPIEIHVAEIV